MQLLTFSLLMLMLALLAQFRAPHFHARSQLWFLLSWLPSELPWAFGALQLLATFFYLALILLNDTSVELEDGIGLFISIATLAIWSGLHNKTFRAKKVLDAALKGLGPQYEKNIAAHVHDVCISAHSVSQQRNWLRPFSFARDGVERLSDIAYGDLPRQRLDIIRPTATGKIARPVLLHVHGGAWILGKKNQQGKPLMNYLAQQGWICVDINYRLAPKHRFPEQIIDVKQAITWIKQNIAEYGGDPDFIAITGGSAGGHLCSLAALTPNQPEFQPGFENADTQVQAAVPLYGIYDFTSTMATGVSIRKFLTRFVMPASVDAAPELWRNASPLHQIHNNTVPMFVLQGSNDCLGLAEEARLFVTALQQNSNAPVLYAEINGAQHAFEMFHAVRTEFTIETVGTFLLHCYIQHRINTHTNPTR